MRLLSGKGAILAAIALGMVTSYIAWSYVNQANSKQPVDMAPVVVATQAIDPRAVITPDMVRVQQLPAEAVHPQALRATDEVVGKVARIAMVPDEQVLSTKLFLQRGDSGLALMVPDGMRAVSVSVNEVIGSGGMILPGDHVDVIGIFQMKLPVSSPTPSVVPAATPMPPITQSNNQAVLNQGVINQQDAEQTSISTLVLQDVPILAIAQQLEGQDTRDNTQKLTDNSNLSGNQVQQQQVRSNPNAVPGAKTATLAVSPDDALKLVLAESQGQIRLALRRPPADDSTHPTAQVPTVALQQPASH